MLRAGLVCVAVLGAMAAAGHAASVTVGTTLDLPPEYGVYYDRHEPAFYTGFAPRVVDPSRIHLHIGRGNQLRITAVLTDDEIVGYASRMMRRAENLRTLEAEGKVKLTQNLGLEEMEEQLMVDGVADVALRAESLSPREAWELELSLMEQLNPGRIHRIRISLDALVDNFSALLEEGDRKPSRRRELELLSALLPTRIWPDRVSPEWRAALIRLVDAGLGAREGRGPRPVDDYVALLDQVTNRRYPRVGDHLEFVEFTAIHPVGSVNEFTKYQGHSIPLYPTPGRWRLVPHQRTKVIDHIPTKVSYSYMPWIPYMHVGTTLHNSFHTTWWRMRTDATRFLPASWRAVTRGSRTGEPFSHLWLLSRGPMSHGCTHMGSGHILELRRILPRTEEQLARVEVFINRSHLYDVFDVDGDLVPEVMGVQYYIAYDLANKLPGKLRVSADRRSFCAWLYGPDLSYEADGTAWLSNVSDALFVGKKAEAGRTYARLRLYEPPYEPERLQFTALVDVAFTREVRRMPRF